jgi:hypothetical protein
MAGFAIYYGMGIRYKRAEKLYEKNSNSPKRWLLLDFLKIPKTKENCIKQVRIASTVLTMIFVILFFGLLAVNILLYLYGQ